MNLEREQQVVNLERAQQRMNQQVVNESPPSS